MSEPHYHHLTARVERGVLVLTILETELRSDLLIEVLRQELLAAVEQYNLDRVVLDLHKVRYLASVGFHPLLDLRQKLRARGTQLILCGLSPVLTEVFRVTRLVRTGPTGVAPFESEPDVNAAIARLADDAEH